MKNRLSDLNNHLFAQIERLSDESLSAEDIEREAKRADAIAKVSDQILDNARITLQACKMVADHGDRFAPQLSALGAPSSQMPEGTKF